MALLTTSMVTGGGTLRSLVAATGGGDSLVSGDRTFLTVNNGGGSPITVTVGSPGLCNQGFSHNLAVSVGAGATTHIGPLNNSRYGDIVAVTYSAVTSVTVGAFST